MSFALLAFGMSIGGFDFSGREVVSLWGKINHTKDSREERWGLKKVHLFALKALSLRSSEL